MAVIRTLSVSVTAKTDKFKKGMKSARQRTIGFQRAIGGAKVALIAFAGVMAVKAVRSMVAFTKSAFLNIDAMAKLSDRLNITTRSIAAFELLAAKGGVSNDQLTKSFERMLKSIGDAKLGLSEAKRALDILGLSVKKLEGLSTEEQFRLIGDALSKVTDETLRATAAQAIFGRTGQKMINVFKGGAESIADAEEKAKIFGLTMSRFDAAQIEKTNDTFTDLKFIFKGFGNQIALEIAPALDRFGKLLVANAGKIIEFGRGIGKAASGAVFMVEALTDLAIAVSGPFLKGFNALASAFQKIAGTDFKRPIEGLREMSRQARALAVLKKGAGPTIEEQFLIDRAEKLARSARRSTSKERADHRREKERLIKEVRDKTRGPASFQKFDSRNINLRGLLSPGSIQPPTGKQVDQTNTLLMSLLTEAKKQKTARTSR